MKHPLFLLLVLLSAYGAVAQARLPAPADTLPGHARLVRALSTTLCAELSSPQAPNFKSLSSPAVIEYVQGLFMKAMQRDSAQVMALMAAAATHGTPPTEVGRQLGRDAMAAIAKNCPAGRPLALRLAQTEQGQQAIAAQQPKLPLAEQKALLPVANALCTALNASNTRTPFSKLTAAGRKQVLMNAIQKAFKPNTVALNRFYGAAKLDALLRSGEFDGRVASLMMSRNMCTEYILLVGSDRLYEPGVKP